MPKGKENKYQGNTGKEIVRETRNPRRDAIDYVSNGGKHKLNVTEWLDSGRPSGQDSHRSHDVYKTKPGDASYGIAKKGISGVVAETGKAFTVRDDYDYANPKSGKGYHVNATLDKQKVAFTKGPDSSEREYIDRTNMTAERYYHDGPEEAAKWYQGEREKPNWNAQIHK